MKTDVCGNHDRCCLSDKPLRQRLFDNYVYKCAFSIKVIESAVEGTRKPEEQIYLKLLDRLKLSPGEVVFLDDIGLNLKAAQSLGFQTIKVHN